MTIEPGVTVKIAAGKQIIVGGEIIAIGTAESNIIFTSNDSTTPFSRSLISSRLYEGGYNINGFWKKIMFSESSTGGSATFDENDDYVSGSTIQYSLIEYASESALELNGNAPYIANNKFQYNTSDFVGFGGEGWKTNGGGAIHAHASDYSPQKLIIRDNIFFKNVGREDSSSSDWSNQSQGGAISLFSYTDYIIERNLFVGNPAYSAGAIFMAFGATDGNAPNGIFRNNVMIENRGDFLGVAIGTVFNGATIEYNKFHRNYFWGGGAIVHIEMTNVSQHIFKYNVFRDAGSESADNGICSNCNVIMVAGGHPNDMAVSLTGDDIYDNGSINYSFSFNSTIDNTSSDVYWGTTDTSTINNLIRDTNDGYGSGGAVNYGTPASAPHFTVNSIALYSDSSYSTQLTGVASSGDTVYVEINATNASDSLLETVSATVTSASDATGIIVLLTESTATSGKYRGSFTVASATDFINGEIKFGDTFTVTCDVDTSKAITTQSVDVTAPTVLSTSPADESTAVAVDTLITATFSEAMESSTINTSTLTVSDGSSYITGTVGYTGTMATFTPSSSLAYSTTYTAAITTGAKDLAGNSIASNHTWSFATGPATDTNAPPSSFSLVYPSNGATGVDTSTYLIWEKTSDPDGDTVSFEVTYCENADFTGCSPVSVAFNSEKVIFYAKAGGSFAGLILFGMIFAGGPETFRKRIIILATLVLIAVGASNCGGGGGGDKGSSQTVSPADDEVGYSVSGLKSGTTYYWKVVADDGKGGQTSSATWSFQTQ